MDSTVVLLAVAAEDNTEVVAVDDGVEPPDGRIDCVDDDGGVIGSNKTTKSRKRKYNQLNSYREDDILSFYIYTRSLSLICCNQPQMNVSLFPHPNIQSCVYRLTQLHIVAKYI